MKKRSITFLLGILIFVGTMALSGCAKKEEFNLMDLPQAFTLLGSSRAQVNEVLGVETENFTAYEKIGPAVMYSENLYQTENGQPVYTLLLNYKMEGEDAELDTIMYNFSYDKGATKEDVWEWIVAQKAALEKHFGKPSDFQSNAIPATLTEDEAKAVDSFCEWWHVETKTADRQDYQFSYLYKIRMLEDAISVILETNECYTEETKLHFIWGE